MALAFGGGGFGKELRDARPGQAVIDIALVGGLRAEGCWKWWFRKCTPWKFNIAPEKWWLEDYFPIGMVHFQWLC